MKLDVFDRDGIIHFNASVRDDKNILLDEYYTTLNAAKGLHQ